MYNSPPSSQITTCTTDLSLLYSLVDKRGSSKEPSPGALDEDTSTSVGDGWQEQKINKGMEMVSLAERVDKVDKVDRVDKVEKVDKVVDNEPSAASVVLEAQAIVAAVIGEASFISSFDSSRCDL